MFRNLLLCFTCLLVIACNPEKIVDPPVTSTEKIDILFLGDSYTKGESVDPARNFPVQLTDSLRTDGLHIIGTRTIAQTGWRTDQLQSSIAGSNIKDSTFSLVTLCIGVNNQYQHGSIDTYNMQFEALLKTALARAGGRAERVVVLSIPDWAYTPYGQGSGNPGQISSEIDQFNAANKSISDRYGVQYVDVTPVSRQGLAQTNLVASDGLHPSAPQYTEWVKLMLPVVRTVLEK